MGMPPGGRFRGRMSEPFFSGGFEERVLRPVFDDGPPEHFREVRLLTCLLLWKCWCNIC
jgi:hypothetical protein